MNAPLPRSSRWVWRAHFAWLGVLAVGWMLSFAKLPASNPDASATRGGEAVLQMLAGIGEGLAHAALISAGLALAFYALVSTTLLIAFKGRALAALAMHGLTVTAVFLAISVDKANSERAWRAEQQRQADEKQRRVDDERAALECLRMERLVLHTGEPLRADVHIVSTCPVTVTGLTVEGRGPGGARAWIFDNHLKHAVSGERTVTVSGRDALPDTKNWVWTVEVDFETERSSLLERLFCGPGASSSVPRFKPCHPLTVVTQ